MPKPHSNPEARRSVLTFFFTSWDFEAYLEFALRYPIATDKKNAITIEMPKKFIFFSSNELIITDW